MIKVKEEGHRMVRLHRKRKVGIIELVSYTVSSEWFSLPLVRTLKRQYYSVMPQAVSVWCRQLGHEVNYATYYGQKDPMSLLPHDLDVVFIVSSTQSSALAYALAKLFRMRGVLTVGAGPHTRCHPLDSSRFFDLVVVRCNQETISDILNNHYDPPGIIDTDKPARNFPSVKERLPEIEIAAFNRERPSKASVISLLASTGCPYSCTFCTDWDNPYSAVSTDQLYEDLDYISKNFPGVCIGFHDANFGIRFDQTLNAFERIPSDRRNPYLMQCSMTVLNPERIKRLGETGCIYLAPGIESWLDGAPKTKLKNVVASERVDTIANSFTELHQHIRGLQANFVFGLDIDSGPAPFELTHEFIKKTPFVWPNLNILTPYGGTRLYDEMLSSGRLLKSMPLALNCFPYLALKLKNYDTIEFYDHVIDLLQASTSLSVTASRVINRAPLPVRIARLAQTFAVRHDIREIRRVRRELNRDEHLRAFHEGLIEEIPPFYNQRLNQRLGRYAKLLSPADRVPLHLGTDDSYDIKRDTPEIYSISA